MRPKSPFVLCVLPVLLIATACQNANWRAPSAATAAAVRSEVDAMLGAVARDLHDHGEAAWTHWFTDAPTFSMATYGVVMFTDRSAAKTFLDDFAPQVAAVDLRWSDLRIEPLAADTASFGASYREQLTWRDGRVEPFAGYCTGVAVRTDDGWRLAHLNRSRPLTAAPR